MVLPVEPAVRSAPTSFVGVWCEVLKDGFKCWRLGGIQEKKRCGLNANGYPTERLPFPFDAIDQVAVELAPFDVLYGGFTGCTINAVTRSGTNEVHGSVFFDYTNDSLQGDEVDSNEFVVPAFNERRYGGTVGFPIIKDKLFFFGAFEKNEPVDVI